jgi:hypothetical protein
MRVRILYHDHCFDGAASAAYFSRFFEDHFAPGAEFHFTGMAHKASQIFEDSLFDGDENVIVDFKYSTNPKLTWWFDHHQSAFLSSQDAEHFRQDRSGQKMFDPSYQSCTKYIADMVEARFGYRAADLDELVEWADIVDGARYSSAKDAVEMKAAAMKLTLVIENVKDSETVQRIIRMMRHCRLDQIIADPAIARVFAPLYEQHLETIDLIRRRASASRGVIYFDLAGDAITSYNKFIPYYLFPEGTYTVSVSNQSFRTKVSVGSSPWASGPLKYNLASICERYGGGGHPRVGAISFEPGEVERARRVAAEIREELSS